MADNRSRRRQYEPGPEQVVVEAIFRGLWQLITWPFRRKKTLTRKGAVPAAVAAQLGSHWRSIEDHLNSAATQRVAVSEADALLDAAMQAAGVIGQTMGDRLKAASSLFPKALYEDIWQAHKLRNTLAHEVGTQLSDGEARKAVATFRSALNYLGVL